MYDTIRVRNILGAVKKEPMTLGVTIPEIFNKYITESRYKRSDKSTTEYLILKPWDKLGRVNYMDSTGKVHQTFKSLEKAITVLKFKESCGINQ